MFIGAGDEVRTRDPQLSNSKKSIIIKLGIVHAFLIKVKSCLSFRVALRDGPYRQQSKTLQTFTHLVYTGIYQ
jgi:hypothetical protein